MKDVPSYLLDILLAASEGQTVAPFDPTATIQPKIEITDISYQKGHTVPEGYYNVRLLDIRCHNKSTYYMKVQILNKSNSKEPCESQTIISGYGSRYKYDFSDLAACFGDGTLLKSTKAYKGLCGEIYLSHSGWITLQFKNPFPQKITNEVEVVFGP